MGTYCQQFSSRSEELLTNFSIRSFSSVFMGADKDTGEIVALKRINTEQEENGFPITAIREVKILKALSHDNIVQLKGIVTSKGA
jgi:cyclin-dependent kinase 12/13